MSRTKSQLLSVESFGLELHRVGRRFLGALRAAANVLDSGQIPPKRWRLGVL